MRDKLLLLIVARTFIFSVVNCDSTFNYEIGYRVHDFVAGFVDQVNKAASFPRLLISSESQKVNLSDPIQAARTLLFPVKLVYPSTISDVFIGYTNGLYYGYIGVYMHINNMVVPYGLKRLSMVYFANSDGTPGLYSYNVTYDCRLRPWYIGALQYSTQSWISPYLTLSKNDAQSHLVIALVTPLYKNNSNHQSTLYGVIGTSVYLSQISDYLNLAYKNTDRSVFIMDAGTGILVGSTTAVPLYYLDSKLVPVCYSLIVI